jgi:very-short-patch-repair endonuclease
MFYGTSPEIFDRATRLRKHMTPAERKLWSHLKQRPLFYHIFRRQHPMGPFIADFYCHSIKLVIELDGNIHKKEDVKQNDIERSRIIESWDIAILRFENGIVLENIELVLNIINEKISMLETEAT